MTMDLVANALFAIIQQMLSNWPEQDLERYFFLAYQDTDMSLQVETTSSRAAQIISQGVAEMLVERMKYYRQLDNRRVIGE